MPSIKLSDDERKAKQREYARRSYYKHRQKNIERAKRWGKANPERKREINAKWAESNPEAVKQSQSETRTRRKREMPEKMREWSRVSMAQRRAEQPERMRDQHRLWRSSNRAALNERLARHRAKRGKAMPKWITREQRAEMKALYVKARQIGWHVDHIIPLNGRTVSGLHVPWNLQLLPPAVNRKKYNTFDDQLGTSGSISISETAGLASRCA